MVMVKPGIFTPRRVVALRAIPISPPSHCRPPPYPLSLRTRTTQLESGLVRQFRKPKSLKKSRTAKQLVT
jgi:hypothetical protein